MKLNNEDKRRLEEVLWMKGIPCYSEMSFDEMVEYQRYSTAAARKIRGTYNIMVPEIQTTAGKRIVNMVE